MQRRIGSLLLAGGILCSVLTGCGKDSTSAEKIIIGYSNNDDSDNFRMEIEQAMQQYVAEDAQYDLLVKDAQGDSQKQNTQVEQLLQEGADIVVISVNDSDAIGTAVQECKAANVPVICVNNKSNTGDTVYTGSENYSAGYMQGEYFAEILPPNSSIVYLAGPSGHDGAAGRRKGMIEALAGAGRSDVTILAEQDCNWSKDTAKTTMQQWITQYTNGAGGVLFQGVIAANDEMALGAVEALENAGVALGRNGVMVSGVDATDNGKQAVKDGKMVQTVLQDAQGQALAAFEAAQMYAIGAEPEKEILVAFKNVTSENIGEYM